MYTGNVMTTEHFHDFYYLEAMSAGLQRAKSGDFAFRRSVEKLEIDLENARMQFGENASARIAFYIWAAALGEARYAGNECEYGLSGIDGMGRNFVYRNACKFPMIEENVETLKKIFAQTWEDGGYGGDAWLTIVESLDMYKSVSNAAFIDYTVDLHHNGGNVFTKSTNPHTGTNWYANNYSASELHRFLGYKFAKDILNEAHETWQYPNEGPARELPEQINVSRKVYRLMVRYNNVVAKINALDWVNGTLEWLNEFTVEWGDEILETFESGHECGVECENCGDKTDEYDVCYNDNGMAFCSDCYNDKHKTCSECGNEIDVDDAIDIGGNFNYEWICKKHASDKGYTQCEQCEEWTEDYVVTEDDSEAYCESCASTYGIHCDECDKDYSDIGCHKAEEHNEAEEGFENTLQTILIETNNGPKYRTIKTWATEDNPLFVYNLNDVNGDGNHWVTYVAGKWLSQTKRSTLREVQVATMRIKDLIDWAQINTAQDFLNLPESTKERIKSAWYGGLK